MAKSPSWSSTEDQILLDNYPTKGIDGCFTLLSNRTKKAINVRASRLGVKLETAWNRIIALEKSILRAYRGCRHFVKIPFSGHTELLEMDVKDELMEILLSYTLEELHE